jgi:O-antigen/teichoic acid export membrane protein
MKSFKVNSLLKNILLLFTGTGIAQVIPMLAAILLARLYTNNDYGDLSVFVSVTGVIGAVATLRYELTIILPEKSNDARNLLALCLVNSVITGLLSAIIIVFSSLFFRNELNISNFRWLYLVPVMVVCTGVYNSFDNWFNRMHGYKKMVSAKIILNIVSAAIRILLGILSISLGLIYGTVTGNIFAVAVFAYFFIKQDGIRSYKLISVVKIKKLFHEYKDFFIYSTPGSLLNAFANIGLPLLIAYFYSKELAGIYFFSSNLVKQPISILSNSISQVYKKEANEIYLHSKNQLTSFTTKFQKTIFVFVFPALFASSVWGGEIFGFIFGKEWIASGEMIKYFAIFILFNSNYAPISSIVDILRQQQFELFFNLSNVVSQILLLVLFSNLLEFKYMIFLISVVGALHYLYIDIYVKWHIKKLIQNEKK